MLCGVETWRKVLPIGYGKYTPVSHLFLEYVGVLSAPLLPQEFGGIRLKGY